MKGRLLLTIITLAAPLLLGGCGDGPDFGPVGGGLAVIGLGIVVAALVVSTIGNGGGRE
jgi:hypothetical protein